ncbi:ABC transporter ATP-binding protein [Labedella endophytica]|uniref:ABC transporter ATP-binding protein n=1 Tax=Labedella endophytica TaxID=1523160 RepID=A0A433JTZ4_9MICO|nr:ABC transporter ATP-binding protein [Labedella endophytica]RUR01514.1 ABC transporter ATP-binding protein [Labedella endophytica]
MTATPGHTTPGRAGLARWLLHHTRDLLKPLGLAIVLRVIGQLVGVALLVIAVDGVVRALTTGNTDVLWPTVTTLVVLALVKAVLRYLEQYSGHYVAFAALASLRRLFFARLAPQAPAATDGASSGDLSTRATRDIDRVEVFFAHTVPPAVSAVVVPIVALVWTAIAVDPTLALVMLPVPVLVVAVIPFLSGGLTWKATRERGAASGRIAGHVSDSIAGVREILGFDHRDARLAELDALGRSSARAARRVSGVAGLRGALVQAVQFGGIVALLVMGSERAATGAIDATDIAVAIAVLIGIAGPTRAVDGFVADLDASFASAARLFEVLEREPVVAETSAPTDSHAARTSSSTTDVVRFDGVSFSYPGSASAAVAGVDWSVPRGAHVAVVGVSGSGKSTLTSLLTRTWDPTDGSLRLEGADVRTLPLGELRDRVAIVNQRPFVFGRSLRDNVLLGAPDASDEQLAAALHTAALDEFVSSLPDGLDTPLRERGARLSGGQLQRLALARAVVTDPDVLVLDESTGALDPATEATVRERLAAWAAGRRTIIEVTHRVDQVLGADEVLVLDRGRVVERGVPRTLADADGPFASLLARV